MSDDRSDPSIAAERRLDELLAQLAAVHPAADPAFTGRVVQRARVQRAIVTPLRTAGTLVVAIADGVKLLLGVRSGKQA
jgi:hypothetical protein